MFCTGCTHRCLAAAAAAAFACLGVKLFIFISTWCLLVVMPVNMTVRAEQ
jgi:hypothetical protein